MKNGICSPQNKVFIQQKTEQYEKEFFKEDYYLYQNQRQFQQDQLRFQVVQNVLFKQRGEVQNQQYCGKLSGLLQQKDSQVQQPKNNQDKKNQFQWNECQKLVQISGKKQSVLEKEKSYKKLISFSNTRQGFEEKQGQEKSLREDLELSQKRNQSFKKAMLNELNRLGEELREQQRKKQKDSIFGWEKDSKLSKVNQMQDLYEKYEIYELNNSNQGGEQGEKTQRRKTNQQSGQVSKSNFRENGENTFISKNPYIQQILDLDKRQKNFSFNKEINQTFDQKYLISKTEISPLDQKTGSGSSRVQNAGFFEKINLGKVGNRYRVEQKILLKEQKGNNFNKINQNIYPPYQQSLLLQSPENRIVGQSNTTKNSNNTINNGDIYQGTLTYKQLYQKIEDKYFQKTGKNVKNQNEQQKLLRETEIKSIIKNKNNANSPIFNKTKEYQFENNNFPRNSQSPLEINKPFLRSMRNQQKQNQNNPRNKNSSSVYGGATLNLNEMKEKTEEENLNETLGFQSRRKKITEKTQKKNASLYNKQENPKNEKTNNFNHQKNQTIENSHHLIKQQKQQKQIQQLNQEDQYEIQTLQQKISHQQNLPQNESNKFKIKRSQIIIQELMDQQELDRWNTTDSPLSQSKNNIFFEI